MEYTTTFELLVGERATAIDDLIVEDAREFAASIDATKWWFERLHTTTGSILNLTFRTTNNIEESIPFLLSQLDRATLRACSKATRGKFSYVPLPDILIPEPSQSAIVGARKAENRIEEWLGEQVAHRIVYEIERSVGIESPLDEGGFAGPARPEQEARMAARQL